MSKHICCVLLVRFLFCENEKRWFKQNLLWTLSEKIGSPAVESLPATSTECSLTLAKLEVIGEERNRGHVTWLTWKVLPRHSKPSPTCPERQVQFLWPSPKYTQRPYLLQPPLSYVMGKRAKAQMHTVLQILHELWHQTTRGVFSSSTEACWGDDDQKMIKSKDQGITSPSICVLRKRFGPEKKVHWCKYPPHRRGWLLHNNVPTLWSPAGICIFSGRNGGEK